MINIGHITKPDLTVLDQAGNLGNYY